MVCYEEFVYCKVYEERARTRNGEEKCTKLAVLRQIYSKLKALDLHAPCQDFVCILASNFKMEENLDEKGNT